MHRGEESDAEEAMAERNERDGADDEGEDDELLATALPVAPGEPDEAVPPASGAEFLRLVRAEAK
jgi:hypothetical protein